MTVFLRAAVAQKLVNADEARIILDAFPDYVVPATVGFVASAPQAVPIPTKPPVYNGMIAPRDSWML